MSSTWPNILFIFFFFNILRLNFSSEKKTQSFRRPSVGFSVREKNTIYLSEKSIIFPSEKITQIIFIYIINILGSIFLRWTLVRANQIIWFGKPGFFTFLKNRRPNAELGTSFSFLFLLYKNKNGLCPFLADVHYILSRKSKFSN